MLNIENFDRKFEHIVHSHQWKKLEKLFAKAEFVYIFGNGGNMGVADHAAIDIARLTVILRGERDSNPRYATF